jgi:anti-sigma-K factor RskA
MRRLVESPKAQVVTLHGSESQPEARGRLIWDPGSRTLQFFAANLRNLPGGRAYELWLINSEGKKIPCGMCVLDPHGATEVANSLHVDPGSVVATAVTDEPAGGLPQPTGAIQLIGNVN